MARITASAVLAHLPRDRGCAVVRDGPRTIVAVDPREVRYASRDAVFALLDDATTNGFWVGFLSYDLGRSIERVASRARDDLHLPDIALARYDAYLVLDGDDDEPVVHGSGPSTATLAEAAWRARRSAPSAHPLLPSQWQSSLDRAVHGEAVRAIQELLQAGDCYQVNLTRRLSVPCGADPVALFTVLAEVNPAPHASLCTFGPALPDVAVVSASPELYLRVEGRHVVSRPIKGTAADPEALAASAKDHAENVMIVDLTRNDLGRVCRFGSIDVTALCEVVAHPGLHHLVSTVEGRLRDDVGFADLVRATFPPASVTGAPKPRVLQAIEDLEPVRRGIYCGAIGWIDGDHDRAELAVAIRTFTVTRDATHLGVGGGIVADSTAAAEWSETELKAARLLAAASGARVDAVTR